MHCYSFEMPSGHTLLKKRIEMFQKQYQNHQNQCVKLSIILSLAICISYIVAKCLRFSCHALYCILKCI